MISRIRVYSVSTALLVAASLVLGAVPAHAQSQPVKAEIPFSFQAGDVQMPAGAYIVQMLNQNVVKIQNLASHESLVLMTNAVTEHQSASTSRITFNRYGSDYFLSDIFWYGYDTGRSAIKSNRELKLAQQTAPVRTTTIATVRD